MLELVLGAVIAIFITIFVENLRKPKLSFGLSDPVDHQYEGRPARTARYLLVDVTNRRLPWYARWMSRDAALSCHASVSFHHLDGQNVFGRVMPGRWSGSTEPIPMQFVLGGQAGYLLDPTRFTVTSEVDIQPGETKRLDIAARFDDEDCCFGWSNLSYLSNPVWRNPDWKLPPGRYLVKVTVVCSGEKRTGLFRLVGDVRQRDFRLVPSLRGDQARE
ncbi:MAG: hypothetical protein AB1578_07645 [Thermodesulfobacteriota bacterium]